MKRLLILLFSALLSHGVANADYSDSFPQANENPLSSSGAWSGGHSSYINLQVDTNRVRVASVASDARMTVGTYSPSDPQIAQVTLKTWNTATGAAVIGFHLLTRWSAPATSNGYLCVVYRTGGSDFAAIRRTDAGVETALGTDQGVTAAVNDIWKCRVTADQISILQNDIVRHSATDSTYTSGRVGLGGFVDTGGATGDVELDDFVGQDLAGCNLAMNVASSAFLLNDGTSHIRRNTATGCPGGGVVVNQNLTLMGVGS